MIAWMGKTLNMKNSQQEQDKEEKKSSGRYFWLKLHKDYFSRLAQKKMKRQEHGKEMQIVYLRMMLLCIDKGGYIYYQGVYDSLEEELSEEFDEPVEIVKKTLDYLRENNMISIDENLDCFVPETLEITGSETKAAERMRKMREKKKNESVTLLHDVTDGDAPVTASYTETETETEKSRTETDLHLNSDKSKSLDVKSKTETKQANADSVSADQPAASAVADAEPPAGDLFSVKQLLATAKKNKVNLTEEGVRVFHDEMHESGWMLYQKPVEKKGIVKALRGWAKYHPEYGIDADETQEDDEEPWPDRCKKYFKEWMNWNGYNSPYAKGMGSFDDELNDELFLDDTFECLINNVVWEIEDTHETLADIRKKATKMGVSQKEFGLIELLHDKWQEGVKRQNGL